MGKTSRTQFGNLTGLRPITTTTNQSSNNNHEWEDDDDNNTCYTKIMRITSQTFERLRDFSHKYHLQPISYDDIFQELLDFYNKEHDQKYF